MKLADSMETWSPQTMLVAMVSVVGVIGATLTTLGLNLWALFNGVKLSWNPLKLLVGLRTGEFVVARQAWTWVGVVGVLLAVICFAVAIWVKTRRLTKVRGDEAAKLSGSKDEIFALTEKAVAEKAKRFGVKGSPGLPVAKTVVGKYPLFSSFEDVATVIAGPRTGKTTSWVVPRILAAPGAVIATSNKRDILDATIFVREKHGHHSWIFDPQRIARVPQQWWWDPLSYIKEMEDAQHLAKVFDDSSRDQSASKNAYFDTEGVNLISNLLLAAALKEKADITQVLTWLSDPGDDEPVMILAAHDETQAAESLDAQYNLTPETRSGVFGTAQQLVAFLTNRQIVKWITPQPELPHFDAEAFVRSKDTLYLLSQEGKGNATAVVTALTVVVNEMAKIYSEDSGGRVPTPIYICLDEAANVCKWGDLPNMYSHFGSRGVVVDTILQSWSQGKEVWGDAGIKKLWSASNVKFYGGGVSEVEFLQTMSELIGDHYIDSRQVQTSSQGTSVSTSRESMQRKIVTPADLAALPSGRAWVFASTTKPVLCETVPWFKTSLAESVNDSIAKARELEKRMRVDNE